MEIKQYFRKFQGADILITRCVDAFPEYTSFMNIWENELPFPCGALAPMEWVSDSRDSFLFPTSKLAVRAVRAHPCAPLSL